LKILKYSIISVLLVILYFIWLDKNYFYNSFSNQKEKNLKLINEIKLLNKKLLNQEEDIKKLKKQKKIIIYKNKKAKKAIKIILPKNNIDYSKLIPKEEYDFMDNKKTKIKIEETVKIVPSITLDEENKVDTIKVNIKTKF
jgi:hypothetical protein